MRKIAPKCMLWKGHRRLEELLDDPVNMEVYGLFQKVKDSPRHISISAENLLNEVHYTCSKFYQDKNPEEHLEDCAIEVEADLGWYYASELVMPMVYAVLYSQPTKTKKIHKLMKAIERQYGNNDYWSTFAQVSSAKTTKKYARTIKMDFKELLKSLGNGRGTPIIQVENADIYVNSSGNLLAREIKYGK